MKVIFYLLLLSAISAGAQQLTVTQDDRLKASWDKCAIRENGEPLSASDIKGYHLVWNCDAGGKGALFTMDTKAVLPDTLLGQCFLSVACEDVDGVFSGPSNTFHLFVKLNKPAKRGFR